MPTLPLWGVFRIGYNAHKIPGRLSVLTKYVTLDWIGLDLKAVCVWGWFWSKGWAWDGANESSIWDRQDCILRKKFQVPGLALNDTGGGPGKWSLGGKFWPWFLVLFSCCAISQTRQWSMVDHSMAHCMAFMATSFPTLSLVSWVTLNNSLHTFLSLVPCLLNRTQCHQHPEVYFAEE